MKGGRIARAGNPHENKGVCIWKVHLWKSTYNCTAVCIWRVADILEEPWPRCPRLGNWGNADLHLSLPTPVYPQSTPEYPHQSIQSPHQSFHTSLSTPGKLNIRAVVPVQVPEWFLRLQPKPIYTRVLCTSTIIVVRISGVYSVDRAIGWYILRQQIETNPLPNIDTCGATLTPFLAPCCTLRTSFHFTQMRTNCIDAPQAFLHLQGHRVSLSSVYP